MKYDYYRMKETVGDKAHLIKKTDVAKTLGITRPTLDVWLKKYSRDTKLINDNIADNKGGYDKLKNEVHMMKEFIKEHLTLNGKKLRSAEVMKTVKKWNADETDKLRALIQK